MKSFQESSEEGDIVSPFLKLSIEDGESSIDIGGIAAEAFVSTEILVYY